MSGNKRTYMNAFGNASAYYNRYAAEEQRRRRAARQERLFQQRRMLADLPYELQRYAMSFVAPTYYGPHTKQGTYYSKK